MEGNTLPLSAQWVGLIGGLTSLVTLVLGGAWAYFRVITRLNNISWGVENLRNSSNAQITLTGALIQALNNQGHLSPQDMSKLISTYTEMAHVGPIPTNPISPDERRRLQMYLDRARQGGTFTPQEVGDYQDIVRRLQEDHPQDRNVWPLIGLGALLLGLFLLGKKEE